MTRRWLMPAEWERHRACLMMYPHNPCVFRLKEAREEFLGVVRAIALHGDEDVIVFANKPEPIDGVFVLVCPSNDTWARDTGPTFVRGKNELVGIDWGFNAYGGLYSAFDLDQGVAKNMCEALSRHYEIDIGVHSVHDFILEGGSIHTDGEGTLLTTQECLLHPNRNPLLTKEKIESNLMESLGINKVIWLPKGLAHDDDTNGHVDNMACFVRPGEIVLAWTDDEEGDRENYQRCRQAEEALKTQTDAKGRNLIIHRLPLPPPMCYTKEEVESLASDDDDLRSVGQRLAASYVNFYIANKAIIVPQFRDAESDQAAIRVLQGIFEPERKVVGVPTREILVGGGNIHCITQQLPF